MVIIQEGDGAASRQGSDSEGPSAVHAGEMSFNPLCAVRWLPPAGFELVTRRQGRDVCHVDEESPFGQPEKIRARNKRWLTGRLTRMSQSTSWPTIRARGARSIPHRSVSSFRPRMV